MKQRWKSKYIVLSLIIFPCLLVGICSLKFVGCNSNNRKQYNFHVISMIFLLRGIETAGTLLFQSIPLYSRDQITCSYSFILIFKCFCIAMKITGFLCYFSHGQHSTRLQQYLLGAAEAIRWDYTRNGYGLQEKKGYSQNYDTLGTCMLKMLKPVKKLSFLTDVRRTVTTSVICVQKIQNYTFLYAELVKEAFGQIYFYI